MIQNFPGRFNFKFKVLFARTFIFVTFSNNIQWRGKAEHHSRGIGTQGSDQMSHTSRLQKTDGENGGLLQRCSDRHRMSGTKSKTFIIHNFVK